MQFAQGGNLAEVMAVEKPEYISVECPEQLISVIIPTRNRKELLKNTLDSCFNQKMSKNDLEIIAFDNDSTDGTKEYLERLQRQKKIKVFFLSKNVGPAVSRNIGATIAKGKYLLLLDDDSLLPDNFTLKNICLKLKTLPSDIKVMALHAAANYDEKELNGGDKLRFYFMGAGAVIERDVLRAIPFDEDFVMFGEEDDLCFRIMLAGYKILYTPKLWIKHSASINTAKKRFLYARNQVWIRFKYYPIPIAVMTSFVNLVVDLIKSLKRKIVPTSVVLGTFSAIFHIRRALAKRQLLDKKTVNFLLEIVPQSTKAKKFKTWTLEFLLKTKLYRRV